MTPSTRAATVVALAMGLLLSLWSIAAINAQTNAAIPRPDLKVGDTWTYTTFDKYKGRIVGTFRVTVQRVEGDEIHVVSQAADGQGDQRVELYTAEWNLRQGGDADRRFDPMVPTLAFPLQEGKTWKGKYTSPSRDGTGTTTGEVEGKVVGFESVTVPAGTFDAAKVRVEIHWDYEGRRGRGAGTISQTIWYAPEAKRWVRFDQEAVTYRGSFNQPRATSELKSLKVN
jgi:hypothetical protein